AMTSQQKEHQKMYRESAIKRQMEHLQRELDEMHPENVTDIQKFAQKIAESGMNETARKEAEKVLAALIQKCKVDVISIGNGTASKESEIFVAGLIKKLSRPVSYIMTNEAGASVYSASKLGAQEFPELDVSLRSAVSIARRLQDPMAELVKIEPKSIGVGQYQHDMNPKRLSESLDGVVESCVSSVGADLNTASPSLLARIAGINQTTAKNICEYRKENRFKKRSDLKKVKGIGDKAYTQCAGFLRVPESTEILDNTAVHPESYTAAKELLKLTGLTPEDVKAHKVGKLPHTIEDMGWQKTADILGIGLPTLKDMVDELLKPGRDPRAELDAPLLREDIMDINSLQPGMELTGTVRNVADFGAFVDIGVHQDGLVHISKLSNRFVKRAMDVVSVGDVIQVRVLDVDTKKNRISLERIEKN
ncbi:MAG: helix-hairpin-helix domain-containing protein, partial [Firmicutes bacterium]|nr:helix-hairpin-helix domain-containing protein [Bacillota bacterium]